MMKRSSSGTPPSIGQGEWLSSAPGGSARAEAVVSGELGLQVGDTATILLPSNKNREIVVTGVLKTPAQYFHPSGAASPGLFLRRDGGQPGSGDPPARGPISTS